MGHLAPQPEFNYHVDPDKDWLKITPEQTYGIEAIILGVSEKQLNEADIDELTSAPCVPSREFRAVAATHVVPVPLPKQFSATRDVEAVSLLESAFGESLNEKLRKFFVSYQAVYYPHSGL